MIITDLVNRNANALKTRTGPFSRLTGDLGSPASMFSRFIAAITTIILPVTNKGLVDALGVVALEVVGLAVNNPAAGRFVRFVLTVGSPVAVPADGDANAGGLTSEKNK